MTVAEWDLNMVLMLGHELHIITLQLQVLCRCDIYTVHTFNNITLFNFSV